MITRPHIWPAWLGLGFHTFWAFESCLRVAYGPHSAGGYVFHTLVLGASANAAALWRRTLGHRLWIAAHMT